MVGWTDAAKDTMLFLFLYQVDATEKLWHAIGANGSVRWLRLLEELATYRRLPCSSENNRVEVTSLQLLLTEAARRRHGFSAYRGPKQLEIQE